MLTREEGIAAMGQLNSRENVVAKVRAPGEFQGADVSTLGWSGLSPPICNRRNFLSRRLEPAGWSRFFPLRNRFFA
jgi:hypothetical protein